MTKYLYFSQICNSQFNQLSFQMEEQRKNRKAFGKKLYWKKSGWLGNYGLQSIFYKEISFLLPMHRLGDSLAPSEEELKSLLMKVKGESEKVGLKLNIHGIWSHHFMGNRWGNNGNSDRLYFGGGSKLTADGDCSHEIKRHLLLGRKIMTNLSSVQSLSCVRLFATPWTAARQASLGSILKSRDITLPTKVRLVKAVVFQ